MSEHGQKVRGAFYTVTKEGDLTDEGIVDEMLKNDDIITEQLIK